MVIAKLIARTSLHIVRQSRAVSNLPKQHYGTTTRIVKMGTASTTAGVKRTASTRKPAAKTTAPSITTSAPLQESLDDKQQSESITAVSEDDRDDKSYFPGTSNFDSLALADDLDDEMVGDSHNWSTSFYGLSSTPFSADIANVLQQEIKAEDVEIKPDGLLYLPEIKYRRILNRAFGPGGWGLAPRGEHSISSKNISREYALVCHGRFVSQARGEQDFFDSAGLATAAEGCKSNALMRCCKDLGVASELWDPVFIRKFKKKYCVEVWTEHVTNKRKKKLWRKKDDTLEYPYKETGLA